MVIKYIMNEKDIQSKILEELGISDLVTINQDGVIDVDGSVDIRKSITIKKGRNIPIQFGVVKGDFNCSYCLLKTLWGSPSEVHGDFNCTANDLTSLKGGPAVVIGAYKANGCRKLLGWDGAPKSVGGNFESMNCEAISAEALNNTKIGGDMILDNNKLRGISKCYENVGGKISLNSNLISHLDKVAIDSGRLEYSDNPISQVDIETDHFW